MRIIIPCLLVSFLTVSVGLSAAGSKVIYKKKVVDSPLAISGEEMQKVSLVELNKYIRSWKCTKNGYIPTQQAVLHFASEASLSDIKIIESIYSCEKKYSKEEILCEYYCAYDFAKEYISTVHGAKKFPKSSIESAFNMVFKNKKTVKDLIELNEISEQKLILSLTDIGQRPKIKSVAELSDVQYEFAVYYQLAIRGFQENSKKVLFSRLMGLYGKDASGDGGVNQIQAALMAMAERAKKPTQSQSLRSYLEEIPSEYLNIRSDETGQLLSFEDRVNAIKLIDEKNGFLEIESDKIVNTFTLAVFKLSSGGHLVGIQEDGASVQQPLRFIKKENGQWKDVTKSVFPEVSRKYILKRYQTIRPNGRVFTMKDLDGSAHSIIRYQLPQVGREIVAYAGIEDDGIGKVWLFSLKFNGKQFALDPTLAVQSGKEFSE